MAVLEYTARDELGNEVAGVYEDIGNAAALREELAKMGYVLIKARKPKSKGRRRKKIKRAEVVAFAFKLTGMYSAGLSVIRCLEALEEQTESHAFREVLADIRQNVETGSSMAKAFEKHRHIFSDFFLGMIEAGESGGKLAEALEMSAAYLEKQDELRHKVKSAFAYPVAVTVICTIVVTAVLIFIVPVFSKLYGQLHVALPGPTQALVILSVLIRRFWWAVLIVSVGCGVAVKRLLKNPKFIAWWDTFKLRMPVFGKLNRMVVVSHFTRTLAMLNSVGVSLIDALDVASQVAHNHRTTQIAKEMQTSIKTGGSVGDSFKRYDIFPPMISHLAASGEEAGVLSEMLNKGADYLDKDIDRIVKALLVKLEPAMTVIMGAIVGLLLMGVYLPIFDYMTHLK